MSKGESPYPLGGKPVPRLRLGLAIPANIDYPGSMANNKNRRPQTPKVGNRAMAKAFQEIRQSNATVPIPSGKAYKRKPKHKEW